jgi:hypothetical protein
MPPRIYHPPIDQERVQLVLRLHVVDQLTAPEIARRTRVDVLTVRRLLRRHGLEPKRCVSWHRGPKRRHIGPSLSDPIDPEFEELGDP